MCLSAPVCPSVFLFATSAGMYVCSVAVCVGSVCRYVFTVMSGVEQGCHLSALLFVVALDPFLQALHSRVGPGCMIRAYVDGVAILCVAV